MKRPCDVCQAEYEAKRPNSKYCSDTCRKRASRGAVSVVPITPPPIGPVEVATLAELTEMGRNDSALGQAALTLARRVDRGAEAPSGLSSLVKQLEATLESVARAAKRAEPSPVDRMKDELARRRAQHSA